mmetsp:Transcript_6240/g.19676  ORF Transcript_6240/g.19676 Transcript_6240/m.19676 type:complete len:223 (-) Transcript_6240:80-748(-)
MHPCPCRSSSSPRCRQRPRCRHHYSRRCWRCSHCRCYLKCRRRPSARRPSSGGAAGPPPRGRQRWSRAPSRRRRCTCGPRRCTRCSPRWRRCARAAAPLWPRATSARRRAAPGRTAGCALNRRTRRCTNERTHRRGRIAPRRASSSRRGRRRRTARWASRRGPRCWDARVPLVVRYRSRHLRPRGRAEMARASRWRRRGTAGASWTPRRRLPAVRQRWRLRR